MSVRPAVAVESLHARAFTIPTDRPESDGTMEWDSTTIVVVQARGGGCAGLGYTYGHQAAAEVVNSKLADAVEGRDALAVGEAWTAMVGAVRNLGRPGIASMAISAVDTALWDLKARIMDVPLVVALDAHHDRTPIYGSGGFCSYTLDELAEQLAGWAGSGIPRVKMKVGRHPEQDRERLEVARQAVGPNVELYVDANGAYSRQQALWWAGAFADFDVRWLEEPVTSDDLAGLRLVRDRGPGGMDVAAGEYGFEPTYFERMLGAGAVDCLQADLTRCGGITGFLKVAGLCDAHTVDISAHCAPQVSAHACTAAWHLRHLEYFHDHVRIESMLFDGVLQPQGGALVPDRSRPGLGLELKDADAARFAA